MSNEPLAASFRAATSSRMGEQMAFVTHNLGGNVGAKAQSTALCVDNGE